jgi:hypothetical protein
VLAFESGGLREPLQRQAGASGFKVDVWIPEIYESVRQVRQICRARWTEMHTSKDGSETNEIGHGKLRVVCNLIVGYQFVCGSKLRRSHAGCDAPPQFVLASAFSIGLFAKIHSWGKNAGMEDVTGSG